MIRDARKRKKTTRGDKDPNPRNKYNLAPETARVGYKYGKYIWGVTGAQTVLVFIDIRGHQGRVL